MIFGNLAGPDTIILVVWLVFTGTWVWALIDALTIPRERWEAAHRSKPLSLTLMIILGWLGTLIYLIAARPALRRQQVG